MAQAGLSNLNPLIPSAGSDLNPLVNRTPPAMSGLDALQQSMADITAMGEAARAQVRAPQIAAPPVQQASGPTIAFSPSRGEFFVQGRTFSEDDAQSALESEALLSQPGAPLPAGDWVSVDPQAYAGYLQGIKEPSLGTLFSKGIGRGIDTTQLLIGRGLQLAGAEETGGRIVAQQAEDLRRGMPYSRQFTDIEDPGDALEWFVAGFGEQVPNLLESVAVAGAGAIGGTFTGGPGVGTAAGALAGLAGKSAFKQQVLSAARKKAAGEVLDEAEKKILRNAGALVGATAATFANSYRTGAADIYGELREQGADPDDISAKMLALAGAFPYAAAESATEYLLVGRIFGGITAPRAIPTGTSLPRRGAELLRRGAVGGAVGGVAEGGTELAQESLLLGLSDQDFGKPENIERLINSFAAGAAIGAPIGAVVNLRGTKPASLLGGEAEMLALPPPAKQLPAPPLRLAGPTAPTGMGGPPLLPAPMGNQGTLPLTGGGMNVIVPPAPPAAGQMEMFPGAPLGTAPQVDTSQLELPFGTGIVPAQQAGLPEIQDVLPFESGLAPRYIAPTEAAPGTLSDNPVLRAIQQRQQEAAMAAQRQAEFEQALAARAPIPEVDALQQRLAESQPFIDVVGTEGTLLPEPIYGTTPAQAAEEWRALAGRGRPKPFASFLPEIQNQWIDALNMAQAGELTVDDLRAIRTELVAAENAARLTKTSPRTVVTGTITPPTPPKGGKARALKKPKAAAVPPAKQPATRGEALKRPAARAAAKPAGKPAAKPETKAEVTAAPVQEGQGKAVQVLKKGKAQAEEKRKPRKQAPSLAEDRSEMTDADRVDAAIRVVEEATTRAIRTDVSDAYYDILELAFFERLSSGTVEGRKAIQTKARKFLEEPTSKWLQPLLAKAFRDIVLREDTLPVDGPWFQFMLDNDLTDAFPAKAKAKVTNIDKIKDAALRAQAEEMFVVEKEPAVATQATYQSRFVNVEAAVNKLTSLLASMPKVMSLDRPFVFRQEQYENLPFALEDLFAETNEADRNVLVNGYPLKDYFTTDGEAKFETTPSGLNTPSAKKDDTGRFARVSVKGTKVVDANGAPLKVLHGTSGIFSTWGGRKWDKSLYKLPQFKQRKNLKIRPAWGDDYTGVAGYFRALRDYYKKLSAQKKRITPELGASWFTTDRMVAEGYGPNVREVYLNIQRPVIYDAETRTATLPNGQTRTYTEKEIPWNRWTVVNPAMFDLARSTDADGIIIKGITDGATAATADRVADIYITFKADQIVPADINILNQFDMPDKTQTLGVTKLKAQQFVSKLTTKPKVSVFRNQGDMKEQNPALYREAVAARPEGDFDTALAAGYSFGDGNVIIFSDRIANEQHLKFVLAHETFGHFGLRGIIPTKQFDAVMEAIYKSSPAIRSDVDIAMADRDQSRSEAVEEYLADFAGVLDTSVVARIWNAIKGALNKLGVKFGDEMVRYILKQSRSYVRSGKSSMFDVAKVFTDLQDVEYGKGYASTGRFSTVGDIYADNRTAELVRDNIANAPLNWEKAWATVKGVAGNSTDRFDRFKAEFLSLANFRSRNNPGLNRLEEILEAARDLTSSIRVSSNERNADVFDAAVFGKYFGVTEEQTDSINKLMYSAQRFAVGKIKDIRQLRGAPLYDFRDGVLTPNQPEIDKLIKQGMVTFEQARDGFTYEVQLPDGTTRDERFAGIPGLTKQSIEWRGYLSLRETVNDVELQLLRARYQSLFEDQQIAFKQFDELVENKRLTGAERDLLRRIIKTYNDLYTADITFDERGYPKLNAEAMENGNDFVVAINKALTLGQDRDFNEVARFFEGRMADDMVAKLREFRTRLKIGADNKFTIQNRVKQILMLEVSNADADLYTRRTLATGYTPLLREGQFQVRVEAVNPRTGKVVRLADAYREQLIYSQVEKQSEAQQIAAGINNIFKDKTYEVDAYSQESGDFVKQNVVFRAVPETALDAIAGPPELNLNEFVYGLRQLDIVLTPKEVERVVTALTKQNSSARNRLLRAFTPGADPDAIKAISRHIDSRASTISKTMMRPQLSELMNLSMESTQRLWNGDARLLAELKAAAENTNLSPDERVLAQREYERYKFMYDQTNPKGKPKRTNQFYNEASRTVSFLDDNRSVTESNFESGEVVSQVRAATSIMQLGGSIATGALNLISAYTNGLPFLASYNPSNGFGGGFGIGPSVAQFHIAAKQVGALGIANMKANTAEFYDEVAKSKQLQDKYGLAVHEAEFIAREIREGAMIPAQTNALINTARGQISSGFARKFIDGWMLPFNLTEQASRRTLGLAAYRLEYERQIAGGRSEAKAKDAARRFAVDALSLTMGEYSVLNRPPAWRSGIQSFLYMYKVFPTTSIQLFSNMSRNGKIAMLASLWLLSGLQGLPFAEDLEDLIDTLAQALGFKVGSIRMEIAKFIDGVFPGMSPYFLQGVVNSAVPADIAGRVSIGNLFPGTGILLSGADVGRELTDIAGPAPSALLGSAQFFADLMRVPFSDRIQLIDVAREAPVTMLRAAGDAVAYAKSDAIVDRRGYVVADEANAGVIATRLLGFYPSEAAQQYSAIRVATRVTDYQRDVVAGFRQAWIKATMEGDTGRARDIEDAVDEWNKGAKGTGLEIADFRRRSQRALKEAQRPAKERMLRTTPKAGREDIEKAFDALSY